MRRRTLLTVVGASPLSLAGCTAMSGFTGGEGLPDACPTSQHLGVEWPNETDLDESTAASFVEEYEAAYYRETVIEDLFEPQSRLDTYDGWITRVTDVAETDEGGWRATIEGVVNVRRGDLVIEAIPSEPPGSTDVIPSREIDDAALSQLLDEAATSGRVMRRLDPDRTDAYLALFEALSEEFELTEVEDSHTFYVDIDGTTVELVVSWSPPNNDHFWNAWYYVDEHVVWRSDESDTAPRDGELLECRPTG